MKNQLLLEVEELEERIAPRVRSYRPERAASKAGGKKQGVHAGQPASKVSIGGTAGLLLVGSDLKLIYVNTEAIQILTYPETPRAINSWDSFLADGMRSLLFANGNGAQPTFAAE